MELGGGGLEQDLAGWVGLERRMRWEELLGLEQDEDGRIGQGGSDRKHERVVVRWSSKE